MKVNNSTILEAKKAMENRFSFAGDDGNVRVSEFESLLDLFTLISFILIFTAFLFVANSNKPSQNASDVSTHIAKDGFGSSATLPQDVLLLIMFRDEYSDKLCIADGRSGKSDIFDISDNKVSEVLSNISDRIKSAGKVELAINEGKQNVDSSEVVDVQKWLAKHQCNFRIYFSGAH
jgi:hypothetical protein